MSSEWELQRHTGRCAASGRPFREGESYYTVLFEEPEGFRRLDFAEEAWNGPPEGCFCCWKARVPVKDRPRAAEAVDSATLVHLFVSLEDEVSEARQEFRFVLGLLLMRKRLVRFEGAQTEGDREWWSLRLVADGSIHRVLNPQLTPERTTELNRQLTALLSGEPEPPTRADQDRAAVAGGTGGES